VHAGEGRVWHPDANIWHLILMSSPRRCLPAGRYAAGLGVPLGRVSPPACASRLLASVRAALTLHPGACTIPLRQAGP
jgi:hypothetical protein